MCFNVFSYKRNMKLQTTSTLSHSFNNTLTHSTLVVLPPVFTLHKYFHHHTFYNMVSAKIISVLAIAATALAAPVEKRSYSGDATYYNPSAGTNSCGTQASDSDLMVALNTAQMANGANPNANPNCGRQISVTGPKGSVTVTVLDTCPGCSNNDLDLSPAAFDKIADQAQGRVPITWDWA
jgi:expansin (peptidoglycan-binding protein)